MKRIFHSVLVAVSSTNELKILLPFISWLGPTAIENIDLVFIQKTKGETKRQEETKKLVHHLKHQMPGVILSYEVHDSVDELLSLIEKRGSDLLMACSGWSAAEPAGNLFDPSLARIIERTDVPVFIAPRESRHPHGRKSILVPMSGEVRENKALELSIKIGWTLGVPVDIIHVPRSPETRPAAIDHYADDAYHELPKMIDEFIAEASPLTHLEERKCLRDFYISRGQTSEEILSRIKENKSHLVAVQWKGTFMTGHAKVLKSILKEARSAVLLVKQKERAPFELKAGTNLRSA